MGVTKKNSAGTLFYYIFDKIPNAIVLTI